VTFASAEMYNILVKIFGRSFS